MSDTIVRIMFLLIKIPIFIVVLYLCLNLYGFFFTYYNVTAFMCTVEQIAMQNNGIPEAYMPNISAMIQWVNNPGSGYSYNSTSKVFKPTSTTSRHMFDNLTLMIKKPSEPNFITVTGSNYSAVPDNYSPAPFGSYIELVCRFNYHWLTPIKLGKGTEAEAAGQTALAAPGLSGDRDVILDNQVIVFTEGDEQLLRINLAYRVPCLRYYPEDSYIP